MSRSSISFTVLALVGAGACKPSVCYFRAEPNVTCDGSQVHLSWNASTGGVIMSNPPDGSVSKVDASGEVEVSPKVPTRYRLDARNPWGHDARDVDVDVVTSTADRVIGASIADPSMQCDGTRLSVTVVAPREYWDANIRAGLVAIAPQIERAYHVTHGVASADLTPGSRSTAFSGLPVLGEWKISTPLQPGESCKNLPRSLSIAISSTCAPTNGDAG
jgi:hypothetical protein